MGECHICLHADNKHVTTELYCQACKKWTCEHHGRWIGKQVRVCLVCNSLFQAYVRQCREHSRE